MQLLVYSLIYVFGTFISAISQVILKKSANIKYSNPLREYLNVRVIVAYAIFFLATLTGIYAYKVIPLSMGPILDSSGYIFVTIFGITFFNEKLNKRKIIALTLIIAGICVYSFSPR